MQIKARLQNCIDLVAVEAFYHKSCHCRFYFNKNNPSMPVADKLGGRPIDESMHETFMKLCQWLEKESESELFTLDELHEEMQSISPRNGSMYSIKRLKQKLQDHYKELLFFAEFKGRKNVVCFRNMASFIINEKWYKERSSNVTDEVNRIVSAAAKLVREEIREMTFDNTFYPLPSELKVSGNLDWLPTHLKHFYH